MKKEKSRLWRISTRWRKKRRKKKNKASSVRKAKISTKSLTPYQEDKKPP
jgi:hypothetical protein